MAVGITSLDDWPMLTASLGWTGDRPPRTPSSNCSLAIPAITSLAFMLVEVPLPVWKTSSDELVVELAVGDRLGGPDDRPRPSSGASRPRSMLTWAAALLDQAHGPDERAGKPQAG